MKHSYTFFVDYAYGWEDVLEFEEEPKDIEKSIIEEIAAQTGYNKYYINVSDIVLISEKKGKNNDRTIRK